MKTIKGTLKLAGFVVDVDLAIDGEKQCCKTKRVLADGSNKSTATPTDEPKKEEPKKKTKKEEPKSEPEPEQTNITADMVKLAAATVADKGSDYVKEVKRIISEYSETKRPKVDSVPVEKLPDLLEAINHLDVVGLGE